MQLSTEGDSNRMLLYLKVYLYVKCYALADLCSMLVLQPICHTGQLPTV